MITIEKALAIAADAEAAYLAAQTARGEALRAMERAAFEFNLAEAAAVFAWDRWLAAAQRANYVAAKTLDPRRVDPSATLKARAEGAR